LIRQEADEIERTAAADPTRRHRADRQRSVPLAAAEQPRRRRRPLATFMQMQEEIA
jgi:hypothetical protein